VASATTALPSESASERNGYSDEVIAFVLGRKVSGSSRELYRDARELMEENDLVEARRLLTEAYLSVPRDQRESITELLEDINYKLVFSPDYRQGSSIHTVESGDTLGGIARKYNVNWRMLQRINEIPSPELIRVNQEIKVIEGRPRILVDKSTFTLTLFFDDYYMKEYPVGLGRDGRTPSGTFTIDSMLREADWYPPDGGVIRYGEEGHLIGTRWIGFEDRSDASGYGIHGTVDPDSIGSMESEGCIRLTNEDVEELYDFLVEGTEVKIVD